MVLHALAALVIGHSVLGRPIAPYEVGNPQSAAKVLVARLHPRERARGPPVAMRLLQAHPTFDLWVIPTVNPDGCARGTRQNAHGVDLNRNFASNWARLGKPGSSVLRAALALGAGDARGRDVRAPHQAARVDLVPPAPGLVRAWAQSIPAARRYARLSGMRFAAIRWPYGTAVNWQNHAFPGTSSFVV